MDRVERGGLDRLNLPPVQSVDVELGNGALAHVPGRVDCAVLLAEQWAMY